MAFFLFCDLTSSMAFAQKQQASNRKQLAPNKNTSELDKKVTSFLLQKQREQALQYINENKSIYSDQPLALLSLQELVSTYFFSQEAQDAYETSATMLLQSVRKADKNNQACLSLEKDNLLCLWQNLRILRIQNSNLFQAEADNFFKSFRSYPQYGLLALSLKYLRPLDDEIIELPTKDSSPKNEKSSFEFYAHLLQILEYNRAVAVKNYSEAKMLLNLMLNQFPDYPDTLYMKAQLAELSAETSTVNSSSLINLYKKKCSSLSAELTRKYFYDIDLCHRG